MNDRLIKYITIREIKALFEQQEKEENYYEPKRVSNFYNINYTEYDNNGARNGNLSLDEYLNEIEPYLRGIIIDLLNSDTWKIQLTIGTSFFCFDRCWKRVRHANKDWQYKIYIL